MNRRSATLTRLARMVALCVVGLSAWGVSSARADAHLDAANRASAATAGTRPAEKELFPALAGMDEPPVPMSLSRDGMREVMLASEGDATWDALVTWSEAEPQRKVLEAMKTIADPEHIYILGIPYGREGVASEWVEAGLYVELGPDGLLYGMDYKYMERMGWAAGLALFESARLASEGKGKESLEVLRELIRLSRVLIERAFAEEKATAAVIALITLERVRDVVFTYSDSFTADDIRAVVEDIEAKAMRTDKIPLPAGDRIAAEQVVERTFEYRGKAEPEALGTLMARADAGDRPLRLFSLGAWWVSLAQEHADWFDTTDKIKAIWNDYELRWKLDLNDPLMDRPSDFLQMDPSEYVVVYEVMKGIEPLFDFRKSMIVELGGTYDGLGVMAFKLQERNYPPQIASIDPKYVKKRAKDLFNLDRRYMRPQANDYPYWVPMRDQKFDRRELPHPYEITVYLTPPDRDGEFEPAPAAAAKEEAEEEGAVSPGRGLSGRPGGPVPTMGGPMTEGPEKKEEAEPEAPSAPAEPVEEGAKVPPRTFTAELDDSYFLLYSVGPNERDDRARNVGPIGIGADDILIWPAVITLERRFNH